MTSEVWGSDGVGCTLGEVRRFEEPYESPAGRRIAREHLELNSCVGDGAISVHNPLDRPIGVSVLVEVFGVDGRSLGQQLIQQYPIMYSQEGEDVPAVPAHSTTQLPVGMPRLDPDTDEELSCEIVDARYEVDPGVTVVDVD